MPLSDWRTNLAPRPRPWREIVDAADWLRHDRGVSKSLWDEACIAMGREEAAIVSATPAEQFTGGRCARVGRKAFSKGSPASANRPEERDGVADGQTSSLQGRGNDI